MSEGLEELKKLGDEYPSEGDTLWAQYSERFSTIEKELKALEIIKEKNVDLKTLKTASICEVDNKEQCEIYNVNKWSWAEDYDFYGLSSVPSKNITQEEFDLLKEVLL